jgi:hypothetical protein
MRKTIVVVVSLLVLLHVFVGAPWSSAASSGDDRLVMEIGVEDLDEHFVVLRTRYFRTSILVCEENIMRIHFFYRNPYGFREYEARQSVYREDLRAQTWYLSVPEVFEATAPPRRWLLDVSGTFPFDTYELTFLVGLSASARLDNRFIDVRLLDESLQKKWSVDRHVDKFPVNATLKELESAQVKPDDFEWAKLKGCFDFYKIRIVFSRTRVQIWRFALYWSIAVLLLIPIVASSLRVRRLCLDELLTVCLGVSFFTVPMLLSLQTYLPQTRIDWIELLYAGEALWTVAFAGLAIFFKKRKSRE